MKRKELLSLAEKLTSLIAQSYVLTGDIRQAIYDVLYSKKETDIDKETVLKLKELAENARTEINNARFQTDMLFWLLWKDKEQEQ